jgi:hypothetical protein
MCYTMQDAGLEGIAASLEIGETIQPGFGDGITREDGHGFVL